MPQRVLALQVELCLPRLIASCAWGTLAAYGLSAEVLAAGPVHPVYSSESAPGGLWPELWEAS
jgi:hypothetical protein